MKRWIPCSLLGLCLALPAAQLSAQTVYQWKDAKGVTHYSDAPPPKGATKRELHGDRAASASAGAAKVPAPEADNAQCAQARLNLTRLQGSAEVGLDKDRDGKIDAPMSVEDRAKQLELARQVIKAECPGGA
jgi:hypothetical protein